MYVDVEACRPAMVCERIALSYPFAFLRKSKDVAVKVISF